MRSECIVFVYLPGETEAVPAGVLRIIQGGRQITSTFVYGAIYKKRPNAIALDPVELPLTDVVDHELSPPRGRALFGVFRDAAPDAWGRLVINDRYLIENPDLLAVRDPDQFELPEMEYLLRAKNDRVGALDFRATPTTPEPPKRLSGTIHLKRLMEESERILCHEPAPRDVTTLLCPGPSLGGVRPKASIETVHGLWMAKFRQRGDLVDVPVVEHATLELAARCNIQVPEHRIERLADGRAVLMVKRFDRERRGDDYRRTHYVSALTALHYTELDQSGASYHEIADFLRQSGHKDSQANSRKELFRRMVFNVLVNNDDDHLRNHGFLMTEPARYKLAPAFDLVPRIPLHHATETREQAIAIGVQGRLATLENALSNPANFGLTAQEAAREANSVIARVADWRAVYRKSGVSERDLRALESAFAPAMKYAAELVEQLPGKHLLKGLRRVPRPVRSAARAPKNRPI